MTERAGTGCARMRAMERAIHAAIRLLACVSLAFLALRIEPATAEPLSLETLAHSLSNLDRHELAQLALTLGVLFFAVTTAIALVRTRARMETRLGAAKREIALLRDEADRTLTLLLGEPQIIVV